MLSARGAGSSHSGDGTSGQARLFTMNISGPSVERAARIADYLLRVAPDAMVLTETRDNAGTRLVMSLLASNGYEVLAPATPHSRERGVAIACKQPGSVRDVTHEVTLGHRLVAVQLELPRPVLLVGVYVPSRDASVARIERKQRFLEQMTRAVRGFAESSEVVCMGDLNVVGRDHLPKYPAFRSWEYDTIDQLAGGDLLDAYSELHPDDQAHSWIGRTGKGYRYDYAFMSASLRDALVTCSYVHEPRELGLTDHAAVDLCISAGVWPQSNGPVARKSRQLTTV